MAESPHVCADGAFRIAVDGTWFHDGAPIGRPSLVRLYATVLRRDGDGAYWLETPVEKVPVEVEDAPFLAVEVHAEGEGADARLRFRTNVDDWVPLDAGHPLVVRGNPAEPRPYLAIGGGIEALVARSVYYELVEHATVGPYGMPGIQSAGVFFPLVPASRPAFREAARP